MTGNEIIQLLTQNIDKFATAIGPVVGAVFTAIFLRRNTTTTEFEKVKAGKLNEVANDLLKSGKMTYTEYYKAHNFLQIAKKADSEYTKLPPSESAASSDFDWFMRFYEAVGNVSNEQMQELWARLLAGEIKKPNSYSLRTIDILKNLSQQEAGLFRKVCSYCISADEIVFLPNYKKYLEKCQITFSELLYLSELGLIIKDNLIAYKKPVVDVAKPILFNKDLFISASSTGKEQQEMNILSLPLTTVGLELAPFVENAVDDDEFITLAQEIRSHSPKSINIEVHRVLSTDESILVFDEQNLLEES